MAVMIYQTQITGKASELNRQLIAAMSNEMTHVQDFQVKLFEFGSKPSLLRFGYWLVGLMIGYGSRLLGRKAILKTGIYVEQKAIRHYNHLLEQIDWDGATRDMIQKNQQDEHHHISRWNRLLQKMNQKSAEQ
jgi:ubiquinone biosynthesis monooxygenase Coq7